MVGSPAAIGAPNFPGHIVASATAIPGAIAAEPGNQTPVGGPASGVTSSVSVDTPAAATSSSNPPRWDRVTP